MKQTCRDPKLALNGDALGTAISGGNSTLTIGQATLLFFNENDSIDLSLFTRCLVKSFKRDVLMYQYIMTLINQSVVSIKYLIYTC